MTKLHPFCEFLHNFTGLYDYIDLFSALSECVDMIIYIDHMSVSFTKYILQYTRRRKQVS